MPYTVPDGTVSVSKKYAYYVFGLLFLLYMFDYIDRLVIVSLFPYIKKDWGLTDMQCGLLVSAVYWSILVFSFPISILVDRWSRKKCIGLMSVLWSIATISCAFTKNFSQLFAARTAIGLGEAGYAPGGTAMISTMFPHEKRARMLGIWNASIPLGSALGIALGGLIAEHFGWQYAFGIVALPGFIIGLLFFFIKDYKTIELKQSSGTDKKEEKSRDNVKKITIQFLRNKTLVFNNFAFAANTFVTTSLLSWLPTYFHRMEGIPMGKAGTKAGIVMLMAIVGAPLGGFLADKWQIKRLNARLLFPSISSFATAIILFIAFKFFQGNTQYYILLMSGFTAIAFVPAAAAVTQDVVHPGLRAISLSICVIIQHVFGSSLGPVFTGALSDRYGIETALLCLPVFALIGSILFLIGSFFYERDSASVDKVKVSMET